MYRYFYCIVCTLFFIQIGSIYAQDIQVYPEDGLVDEKLTIVVTGLSSEQPAIIRAQMRDIDGRLWQSFAGFYADQEGIINLSKQAPTNGDYTGVDEMGLILSMQLPLDQRAGARFTNRYSEPIKTRFSVEVDDVEVDSITVTRRFLIPGVEIQQVREDGLVGTFFKPAGKGSFPGLIILGGSEGGLSNEEEAALFASHGYASLALAYFGMKGLPELLQEIPLEYFKKAIDWMSTNPHVSKNMLGMVGTSKGGEAALLSASYYSQIKVVIGYVPCSVVWGTIYMTDKSSWSFNGTPFPYIPLKRDPTYKPLRHYPIRPAVNYSFSLNHDESARKAIIPVEKIKGPVLLISGEDDQVIPSFQMCEMIMERLKTFNHPFLYKHLHYKSAGHSIKKYYYPMANSTVTANGRLVLGGTYQGNVKALHDSWPKVLDFLSDAFVKR